MFFYNSETATAGSALKAPKKSSLYFYASYSTVEEGAAWAEERCDWELIILHHTEFSIKRRVKERKSLKKMLHN